MVGTEGLSDKIRGSLERHQREIAERQKLIEGSMDELLAQREHFAAVARRIIASVIRPRMSELARHFDNSTILEHEGNNELHCTCHFSHTPRFPATVSFAISLLPGEDLTGLVIRYDLTILPVLMDYKRDEEAIFPLDGSENLIGQWAEEKIIQFIDTYLRLETHPLYQKDNLVLDPVCGMQISTIAATSSVEMAGRTIYFCSEACREAFSKKNQ